MSKQTPSERAAKQERKQIKEELRAQFPGDEERIRRELDRLREHQERRAEEDRLAAEDTAAWADLTDVQRDAWTATYMDTEVAIREVGRVSRQRGGGGIFSGSRPSRFAPLRAKPRGGP